MSSSVALFIVIGVGVGIAVMVVLTNSSEASSTAEKRDEGIYLEVLTTTQNNLGDTHTKSIRCGLSASLAGMETVKDLLIKLSDPYNNEIFYHLASVNSETKTPQVMMEIEDSQLHVSGEIAQNGELFSNLTLSWNFNNFIGGQTYKCVATGIDRAGHLLSISKSISDDSDPAQDTVVTVQVYNEIKELVDSQTKNIDGAIDRQTANITERMSSIEVYIAELKQSLDSLSNKTVSDPLDLWIHTWATRFDFSTVYKGKIYLASKSVAAFDLHLADQTCQLAGGYLVELDDDEEFNFVREMVMSVGGTDAFFTGTNDIKDEGKFVHEHSGKPLEINQWSQGQPDNYLGVEDCVHFFLSRNGYLNDYPCDWSSKYVCEVSYPPLT